LVWLSVAGTIVALVLANRMVLSLVMIDRAPLGATLIQMILTILIYQLIVFLAHFVFGVTRPAMGEVNTYGHRI